MVIKLSDADQKQLNGMIERILFDVQRNELSPSNARDALVRTVTAAAIDNEKEFYEWLDPEHIRRWKRELSGKRS
jgi:hypothetical protein